MKTPLLSLLLLLGTVTRLSSAEVGLVARAEAFALGKTYLLSPAPADRAAGKYDCTTFVQAVLKEAGYSVSGATGNKINISPAPANLAESVRKRQAQIKGVVHALLDSSQGTELSALSEAKPGDIIQMWRIIPGSAKDKKPVSQEAARGHTGVIKSVDAKGGKVTLVGAHNVQDGVGTKTFDLGAGGWPIYFLVRPQLIPEAKSGKK